MSSSDSTAGDSLRSELRERCEAFCAADPNSAESDIAFASLVETTIMAFAATVRDQETVPLPSDHRLTATDVATVCSQLLEAADLQVFELGLWRSWAGSAGTTTIDPRQMRGQNL